jgi:hypothetical protein
LILTTIYTNSDWPYGGTIPAYHAPAIRHQPLAKCPFRDPGSAPLPLNPTTLFSTAKDVRVGTTDALARQFQRLLVAAPVQTFTMNLPVTSGKDNDEFFCSYALQLQKRPGKLLDAAFFFPCPGEAAPPGCLLCGWPPYHRPSIIDQSWARSFWTSTGTVYQFEPRVFAKSHCPPRNHVPGVYGCALCIRVQSQRKTFNSERQLMDHVQNEHSTGEHASYGDISRCAASVADLKRHS